MKTLYRALMSLTLFLAGTQRLIADELLIFTADWCGACQKLKNDVKENPDLLTGLTWGFINTDKEPELTKLYKVRSLPTLVLVDSDNKEVKRTIGYDNPEKLKRWLDSESQNMSFRSNGIFNRKR